MSAGRLPCKVRVQHWLKDHCVGERIVLPAVETLLFLAEQCAANHPEADIRVMEEARFGKFLEVPPAVPDLPVLVEEEVCGDGRIRMKLASLVRFKAASRIKEHGDVTFSAGSFPGDIPVVDPAPPGKPAAEVDAQYLYRHLVPFGSNYHTLQDTLLLTERGAWGRIEAPALPFSYAVQEQLGSPFPLDGAMHAACVLGQRLVDFVPFPVGFARRIVNRPTQPGKSYLTRATLICKTRDELMFDLEIFSHQGEVFETVETLRMRDVGAFKK